MFIVSFINMLLGIIVFTSYATAAATITFDVNDTSINIGTHLLGTNLPAWLGKNRTENQIFLSRTKAAGVSVIRIPGGSWSNGYNWLACETGTDIEGKSTCGSWGWGLRPTDFINFLRTTGSKGMYTVNQNGTSREAAALVAFFNGAINDTTAIGVDVRGRDWLTVGHWAQLRSNNGNPDPINIKYWEIGNEVYGGKAGNGKDCQSWGWEDVWTCDGSEYVNGIGSGVNRKEGYLEFRDAMRAVDPSIMVGAVGVSDQDGWGNWGNEVIAAAGGVMDFYIVHEYAYWQPPTSYQEVLAQPQTSWQYIMSDIEASFEQHAGGRNVPIAVTEYNLFSSQDQDNGQWMTRGVNMLFLADTIGQMMTHGFDMANQWDLANGRAGNGTDYGLLDADTYARSPQYYSFPLWARFGSYMLPVVSSYPADTVLSVYAGKIDPKTISLLAINKTSSPITATIKIDGTSGIVSGTADIAQVYSLDDKLARFNGITEPANDLSKAPSMPLTGLGIPFSYTFAPYSVTLLRFKIKESSVPGKSSLPAILFLLENK